MSFEPGCGALDFVSESDMRCPLSLKLTATIGLWEYTGLQNDFVRFRGEMQAGY
jgi:hypothetical protein